MVSNLFTRLWLNNLWILMKLLNIKHYGLNVFATKTMHACYVHVFEQLIDNRIVREERGPVVPIQRQPACPLILPLQDMTFCENLFLVLIPTILANIIKLLSFWFEVNNFCRIVYTFWDMYFRRPPLPLHTDLTKLYMR